MSDKKNEITGAGLYTPEQKLRRDQTVWTLVQGVLAPLQFLVFAALLRQWCSILYRHAIALAIYYTAYHNVYKKKRFLLLPSSPERYLFFSVENREEYKR